MMDILLIVESNQEARVQNQHGEAASPAIDDGVDLFAQALVSLRVFFRRQGSQLPRLGEASGRPR